MLRRKLVIAREGHEQAAHFFVWRHYRITLVGYLLIAAIAILEGFVPYYEAASMYLHIAVIVLCSMNAVVRAVGDMLGSRSSSDRHVDAALMYNTLLQEFDCKVLMVLPASARGKAFREYMYHCSSQVTQLGLQAPIIPKFII